MDDLDELLEKVSGLTPGGPFHQKGEGELAGPIDGDKKVELGFKQKATGPNTIEYKIGEIFGEIKNKGSVSREIFRCSRYDAKAI